MQGISNRLWSMSFTQSNLKIGQIGKPGAWYNGGVFLGKQRSCTIWGITPLAYTPLEIGKHHLLISC